MNTYTWNIESLEVAPLEDGLTDVVKGADYWVEAVSDDGVKAQHHGHVSFSSPNADTFTEYSDLTKDNVMAWINNSFNGELVIEQNLDAKIEQIKMPAVVQKDLPWS